MSINVGIYFEPLHELLGEPIGATFCTNLGYLGDSKSWASWVFERDDPIGDRTDLMHREIVKFGIPFMVAFENLDDVIRGCRAHGFEHQNVVRIPGLFILNGKADVARAMIQGSLASFEGKADGYSIHQVQALHRLFGIS